jgi:pre-mRNA-processing factor 17
VFVSNLQVAVEKWLAMQSLDNQILVYSSDSFRQNRKKRFAGHTVSGYACEIGFSPDGRWISSGDGSGNMHFWDFKTSKKMPNRLKAHNQVVISHTWLPHETVSLYSSLHAIHSNDSPFVTVQACDCVVGW